MIDVMKGTEVDRIDKENKEVFFGNAGGEPRKLGVLGEDME